MKKFIVMIVLVFSMAGATQAFAYEKGIDGGDITVFGGVGFGFHGMYSELVIPPILAGFDYCVKFAPKVPVTFGGIFGYARSRERVHYGNESYTWSYNYFFTGFRTAYHFTELLHIDNLDLYAGLMVGYAIVDVDEPSGYPAAYSVGHSFVTFGVYGGARYYFTENFGVYAEAGYGLGYINGGVVLKF